MASTIDAARGKLAVKSLAALGDKQRVLERGELIRRIDSVVTPVEAGVQLRAGLTKKGAYVYYREDAFGGEVRDCKNVEIDDIQGFAVKGQIGLYYRSGQQIFRRKLE